MTDIEFDFKGKLEYYSGELRSIISTLDQAYVSANLRREDGPMFLTVELALERLAEKIEKGE